MRNLETKLKHFESSFSGPRYLSYMGVAILGGLVFNYFMFGGGWVMPLVGVVFFGLASLPLALELGPKALLFSWAILISLGFVFFAFSGFGL